jgi:hypothetical protein
VGNFSDLREFLVAVMRQWIFLMSGIVSILITFWEKVKEFPIATRAFYGIAIACVFTAFYLAWRDEHNKYKPEIKGEIDHTIYSSKPTQNISTILLFISINNIGDQTSLDGWKLEIKFPGGEIYNTEPIIYGPGRIVFEGMKEELDVNNALYAKAMNPIPKGAIIRGFLNFTIPVYRPEDQWSGTQLKLSFKDVLNQEHYIIEELTADRKTTKIKFLPGLLPEHPKR